MSIIANITQELVSKVIDNLTTRNATSPLSSNQGVNLLDLIETNTASINTIKSNYNTLNATIGTKASQTDYTNLESRVTNNETAISKRAMQTDMTDIQGKVTNILNVTLPSKSDVSALNAHISTSSNPHPNWKPTFANISGSLSGSRLDNSSVTYNKLASDVVSQFTNLWNSITSTNNSIITNHNSLNGLNTGNYRHLTTDQVTKLNSLTKDHNSLDGLQGGQSGQYYHINQNQYNGIVKLIGSKDPNSIIGIKRFGHWANMRCFWLDFDNGLTLIGLRIGPGDIGQAFPTFTLNFNSWSFTAIPMAFTGLSATYANTEDMQRLAKIQIIIRSLTTSSATVELRSYAHEYATWPTDTNTNLSDNGSWDTGQDMYANVLFIGF